MLVRDQNTFNEVLPTLNNHTVVVDVETNGFDSYGINQICGIGVGFVDNLDSYYFPFRHQQVGNNLPSECLDALIEWLNQSKHLVGYNIKFDLRFLEKEGLLVEDKTLIDVLTMVRLTESSTVKDLDLTNTIKRSYGESHASYDLETKKVLRSNKWNKDFSLAPIDVLGPYCEKDVLYTAKLFNDRLEVIKKSKQVDVLKSQMELTKVLYAMEGRGIKIDNNYVHETMLKLEKRKDEIKKRVLNLAGKEFNLNSTQQLGEILNERGIISPEKTAKGQQSWNEAALVQINDPIAGYVRQYRALEKLRSTYLEPFSVKSELHTTFCNWGTLTGRLSSRNPNLQNIPRNHFNLVDKQLSETDKQELKGRINATLAAKGQTSRVEGLSDEVLNTWTFVGDESFDKSQEGQIAIRNLFVPRDDYKLVSFDYSQMEVRVFLSYLQNEEVNQMLTKSNVDFHGEAAKLAFNVTEDDETFKMFRQTAKSITFGTIYGIGNQKLGIQLGVSAQEAAAYKKKYFDGIKGSREFFNAVVRKVELLGQIKNKYGRVYQIPKNLGYKGINYLVQGTSADILNERMIQVHKLLGNFKSNLLLQVHDEIICEIHKDEMETLPNLIRDVLVENTLRIPLEVDIEICEPSWAVKKDYFKKEESIQEESVVEVKEKELAYSIDWS
tara:strand:+ start:709 stop:2709 length:2001 start_codon:yes stop_codon:yes gene_type:complete